jgi:hypothetical protein
MSALKSWPTYLKVANDPFIAVVDDRVVDDTAVLNIFGNRRWDRVVDPDVFVKSVCFGPDDLAEAARLVGSHFVLMRKEQ